jgi:flagellar basal-body rod protein FlgB
LPPPVPPPGKTLPPRPDRCLPHWSNQAHRVCDCAYWVVGTALALVSIEEINDMFENIFGIHEQALLLHGQRLGVLATNMANADTPNFKARDIDFSEVLAGTSDSALLPMRTTQVSHIAMNDAQSAAGELKYRNPFQASLDGNTVEMPVEQAAFSENNVRYQASLMFINNKIAELQFVIAGQ